MNPGNPELIEAVGQHIDRHVGDDGQVFHEIVSDKLHIDVFIVPPNSSDRPYHTLVTSGMSEFPMNTGDDAYDLRYAELCILLDPDWQLTMEAYKDERWYWPLRLLKTLARYPSETGSWLGYGHSVASADPPEPYAPGTGLCAAVLMPPVSLGEPFFEMTRADGAITHFWTVIPLHESELRLKMGEGLEALTEAFDRSGVTDVVRHDRQPAV
jgi:hypothetical protein